MKCAKCGNELKDDQLYCDKCGYEIQIVPNFEPELEHEIHVALTGVAEDIDESQNNVLTEKSPSFFRKIAESLRNRKRIKLTIGIISVFVFCAFFLFIYAFRTNSYDYQLNMGKKAAQLKEYTKAIRYTKHAIELNDEEIDTSLLLADYYYKNGEKENAVITLQKCIESYDENESAYRKIIEIYKEDQKYDDISALLLNCKNESILTQFQSYTAFPPEFSLTESAYDETVPLQLTAGTSGTIYYTLDGTEPTKVSSVYLEPIELTYGNYTVKAIFINSYGSASTCAEKTYRIEMSTPLKPEVSPYSGAYNSPQMVSVENTDMGTTYFTIDGSDPTEKSDVYRGSITMPLGTSRFKFITYGDDGTTSEITERIYDLKLNKVTVSIQDAINLTMMFLYQNNYITDMEGHYSESLERYIYSCTTAISENGSIYYLVTENNMDLSGNQTETGNIFAVDAMNGAIGRAQIGNNGAIHVTLY